MLLDTSGLLAFLDEGAKQHHDAVTYFHSAQQRLIHSYVLVEFIPLATVRGHARAPMLAFGELFALCNGMQFATILIIIMENQWIRSILNHESKNGKQDRQVYHADSPEDTSRITLEQASEAASRAGIDMRMFELQFEPGPYYGYISQTGSGTLVRGQSRRILLTLQEAALASERDAVETIAHELNHVRAILKTGSVSSESVAEISARQAGCYFR